MAPLIKICSVCGKPGKACSGCQNSFYCGRECQKEDWKSHRMLCSTFNDFADVHRTTSTSKRAIHFPEKGKCAFIWIDLPRKDPEDSSSSSPFYARKTPDLDILLGEHLPKTLRLPHDFTTTTDPPNTIEINRRNTATETGIVSNQSIAHIIHGKTHTPWSGPIVASGYSPRYSHCNHLEDLDTVSLRFLVEFFQWYGTIRGIRINSNVSQLLNGRPIFDEIWLPVEKSSELFSEGQQSQIAKRIGTPLRAVLEFPTKEMEDSGIPIKYMYATYLHMNCELNSKKDLKSWGCSPEYWHMYSGDTIVVRQDKKRLCPKYLEALSSWCWQIVQPMFEVEMEGRPSMKRRDLVLAQVTKEKFEVFKEKYEKEGRVAKY